MKAIAQRREAATLEGLVDRVLCHDVRDGAGKIAVEKGARLTAASAKVLLEASDPVSKGATSFAHAEGRAAIIPAKAAKCCARDSLSSRYTCSKILKA